jgi:ABC-type transport system involved in cytochrome c biogenesis permease subunit
MTLLIQIIIYITLIAYTAGAVLYFTGVKSGKKGIPKDAFILALIGGILNLIALIIRTIMAGRLPLTTGYEFILSFTFITVLLYLVYEAKTKFKGVGGAVMTIAAVLILSVIIIAKGQLGQVSPLMPALKSPWLAVHVLTSALAYAGFALAAGLAVMHLVKADKRNQEENIYKIVAVGFVLLSLSIVLGAIWAEQAWGSYWSWDPKEVWALVTWIVYAVYLHLYSRRYIRGNKASIVVIFGFVIVLFTFFGVNYLLSGLHSYAGILSETSIKIS